MLSIKIVLEKLYQKLIILKITIDYEREQVIRHLDLCLQAYYPHTFGKTKK